MENTHFLIVKLIDNQNCFVKVSCKLLSNQPLTILKVIIGGQVNSPHYFTAVGHNEKQSDTIHFPKVLGHHLGLNNGSLVPVRFIKERASDVYRCNLLLIEPKGIDISGYSNQMTEHILDQIRVIYTGLVFPFWVSSNKVLFFKVTQINPDVDFSILVKDSLIEIGEDESQDSIKISSVADKFISFLSFFRSSNDSLKSPCDTLDEGNCDDTVDSIIANSIFHCNPSESCTKYIFNVSPCPSDLDTMTVFNTVWVNSELFGLLNNEFRVLILNKLLPPYEKAKCNEQKKNLTSISKMVDSIDRQEEDVFLSTYTLVKGLQQCPNSCIYLSDNLRKQMDLSFNSKVFFRVDEFGYDSSFFKFSRNDTIHLWPINVQTTASPSTLKSILKSYVKKYNLLLLCRGSVIDIDGQSFIVACDPGKPLLINELVLDKMDIKIKETSFNRLKTNWGKLLPSLKLPEIQSDKIDVYLPYPFVPWMDEQLESATKFLQFIFNFHQKKSGNTSFARNVLLIHGAKGSGKTCLLKHLIETKFTSIFTKVIQCGSWKTISSLKKQWLSQIAECIYAQPSILIFENLDLVAPSISRLEEIPGADTIASIRASFIFASILKSFDELNIKFGHQVAIVATCSSQFSLNPILTSIRGRPLFSETISLDNPNFEQRKQILQNFLDYHVGSDGTIYYWLDQISYRCEGYLIADLLNLVDSAIHNRATTNHDDGIGLENFEEVLKDFHPSIMTDIRVEKNNGISFGDVGGLTDVKNLLRSTLLLPLKYPLLFSKCPIRPPRNILLYGAPGTGKSLIAEALASESKVNLIKIRGPELLSKYIGRSEESIRELFERAAIAKPCIIFFDEFESLAPRRGQDTTGVTDRVVNQLLAQMDGVEVIEQGVYCIAATSRPDLLDPALLRPGRFDKYICCNFPSDEDRLDIWKVLGKNLNFDERFNHDIIPQLTQNFTGADIRALLINSQYEAIEEYENSNCLTANIEIKICDKHVACAKSKTKPCIDSFKRDQYRLIYDKFSGIEGTNLPIQQRATLA